LKEIGYERLKVSAVPLERESPLLRRNPVGTHLKEGHCSDPEEPER
jgi:hypothetical protein